MGRGFSLVRTSREGKGFPKRSKGNRFPREKGGKKGGAMALCFAKNERGKRGRYLKKTKTVHGLSRRRVVGGKEEDPSPPLHGVAPPPQKRPHSVANAQPATEKGNTGETPPVRVKKSFLVGVWEKGGKGGTGSHL